jgi:hypothetical protein
MRLFVINKFGLLVVILVSSIHPDRSFFIFQALNVIVGGSLCQHRY